MGQIKVAYSYNLSEIAGVPQETIEISTPICLGDLLAALGSRHGEKFIREIKATSYELGAKSDFYLIFVNGEKVSGKERDAFIVTDSNEVKFLPLISGG
jgi:molybdopterin converting factor small subunit